MIYEVAKRHHLQNLELEAAEQPQDVSRGRRK